jgi:hypothetical protein
MKRLHTLPNAKYITVLLVIVLMMVITACGMRGQSGEAYQPELSASSNQQGQQDPGGADARYYANERDIDQTTVENQDVLQAGERVILMDASLSLVVDDSAAKVNEIRALAVEMGGWVVSSSTSVNTTSAGVETVYGNVTIRVPSERLYEAMDRIKVGVGRVVSENINGQDVTQDYIDTSSRLTNLEASEEQLQTIMDSALTVEEVLAVQEQLTLVRGEIEVARGRIQFYDEAAAFSAITVYLSPPSAPYAQNDSWNPLNTVQGAFNLLVRVLRGAVDLIIGLVIFVLPLLILFGIPGRLLWKRFGHRFARKPSPSPATPPAQSS